MLMFYFSLYAKWLQLQDSQGSLQDGWFDDTLYRPTTSIL